jgi:molybdate transport system regulatory protein
MEQREKPKTGTRKPSRFGRHPHAGYTAQASVWVEKDGELYIGGGRAMLLEKLDQLGSIAAAARFMGLTYRNACLWIVAMNRLAPSPLVETITGGSGGGHARLTDEGHRAIEAYKELRSRLSEFIGPDISFSTVASPEETKRTKKFSRARTP